MSVVKESDSHITLFSEGNIIKHPNLFSTINTQNALNNYNKTHKLKVILPIK